MIRKIGTVLLLLWGCLCKVPGAVKLNELCGEHIVVSVLINSPGNEAYSSFGHAALRVRDTLKRIDIVANYGVFDFDAPHFIYRFVKGETDYMLAFDTFERALNGVKYENREMRELVLNLLPNERQTLVEALAENGLPQNRIYRYNFIYDNCATRLRDIIEENVTSDTEIVYHYPADGKTFRELIHEYVPENTWLGLGMDILIGVDADRPQQARFYSFLPDYLQSELEQAVRIDNGKEQSLVCETKILSKKSIDESDKWSILFSPLCVSVTLFVCVLLLTCYEWYRKAKYKMVDGILYLLFSIAGFILLFMNLVSQHPLVSPNYLIFFVNPLLIVGIPVLCKRSWTKKYLNYFCVIHLLCIGLCIFAWLFLSQTIPVAMCFFIVTVALRSMQTILMTRRNKSFNSVNL